MYVRQLGLLVCILPVVVIIVQHPHGRLLCCCSAGVIVFDWSTSPFLAWPARDNNEARQRRFC
jgi:hypothetical protein